MWTKLHNCAAYSYPAMPPATAKGELKFTQDGGSASSRAGNTPFNEGSGHQYEAELTRRFQKHPRSGNCGLAHHTQPSRGQLSVKAHKRPDIGQLYAGPSAPPTIVYQLYIGGLTSLTNYIQCPLFYRISCVWWILLFGGRVLQWF